MTVHFSSSVEITVLIHLFQHCQHQMSLFVLVQTLISFTDDSNELVVYYFMPGWKTKVQDWKISLSYGYFIDFDSHTFAFCIKI